MFSVGALPTGVDRAEMTVEGDGATIPRDATHADGWDFANGAETTIRIFGARCAAIGAGTLHAVRVRFPCHPG